MTPTSSWSSGVGISRSVTISTENVFQASRCKSGFAHLKKGEANGGERGGRPVEFKSTFRPKEDGTEGNGVGEGETPQTLPVYASLKVRKSVGNRRRGKEAEERAGG